MIGGWIDKVLSLVRYGPIQSQVLLFSLLDLHEVVIPFLSLSVASLCLLCHFCCSISDEKPILYFMSNDACNGIVSYCFLACNNNMI